MPTLQADIAALVLRMPDTDEPGKESTFTGPEPQAAVKIFEEILAGAPGSIAELIRLLRASTDADFKDYRAEYVLHGLAVYVGHPDRANLQRVFAETLAAHVGRAELSKGVRGCLIRELQCVGGQTAVEAIAGQLQDEDLCTHAVSALVAIGPPAAKSLRGALPKAKGKSRLAVVQALGALGDAAAVGALREAIRDEDRDTRMAAVWALANIGDAGSADVLIKASDMQDAWERVQAAKSCLLLAEKLTSAGKKADAAKVYSHLRNTRQDPAEQYIREAAERGLAAVK